MFSLQLSGQIYMNSKQTSTQLNNLHNFGILREVL